MKKIFTAILFGIVVFGASLCSSKADVHIDVTVTNLASFDGIVAVMELSGGDHPVDIDPTFNEDFTHMYIDVAGVNVTDMIYLNLLWFKNIGFNEQEYGGIQFINLYGTGNNSDSAWTLFVQGYVDPVTSINTCAGTLYRSGDVVVGVQ